MLALTPAALVGWFYLYVLRQRLELGFWPRPSQPDPKDAGHVFHHLSIYLGVLLVPLISIFVACLIVQRAFEDKRFLWWLAFAVLVLSFGCYLGVMYIDPGDFWAWFRD